MWRLKFINCIYLNHTGPERYDDIDGGHAVMEPPLEDSEDGGMCTYLVVSSPEKLLLNVTTPAITVLREILQV